MDVVAQRLGLVLHLVDLVLHKVADRDEGDELPVLYHGEVAEAAAGHHRQSIIDRRARFNRDGGRGHDCLHWQVEAGAAVIGEVTGERAPRPFADPIVGVREMVLLQPHYRQVFFERFGYESPLYGHIDASSLLRTSQHTHFGLMIANDDPKIFDFYDGVLGLKRMLDDVTPYENATGSRRIFGLEPGEGFHMVDFDDPASGHALHERRSGKLKCVRFSTSAKIEHKLDRSRAGCLGYSLYCWRVDDIDAMFKKVGASEASGITPVQQDEFGRRSFTFFAPDGYHWMLLQA